MLRNIISEREEELPISTIGKLIKIAEEEKDIISLGPGEPDFDSPKNVIKSAKNYLERGYTHYSPPQGRESLREEIVKKLKRENKINVSPEQVIVTCGSTEALLLSLMCTIDPGEGVLLPDPSFLAYKPMIEILNGMPLCVPLHEEDGFQLSVDRMKEVIIPEKTRVIIINTPSNPTGTVLTKKTLEELADFAVEHNLLIVSDEAYEKFVYDDARHISIGSLNGMEDYVLTLHSFSKTYAMPGFRIGYAAGPEEIIKAMSKLHVFTSFCAPTISQMAALDALKGDQSVVERMRKEYDRRRRMMLKRIKEIPGFRCIEPKGAFYLFPNIMEFGMSSLEFAEWLLKKAGVAVVPGIEFGKNGEGFVRLSYATSYELIEKVMDKIEKAVDKIKI